MNWAVRTGYPQHLKSGDNQMWIFAFPIEDRDHKLDNNARQGLWSDLWRYLSICSLLDVL